MVQKNTLPQLKENCTKHEALLKATALAGGDASVVQPSPSQPTTAKLFIETNLDKIAVLTKVFTYYQSGLPSSKKAVAYLESRSIDYQQSEIAFNSGGLHVESKNHHLIESMVQYGLLKPRPAGGYSVWAKDCVIFPLKNGDNKIISLYGRSITNNSDQRHFYLTGREGLYPCYPKPATTKLILTESIIDAVSLLQQPGITSEYEILALYGTNGLTDEHQQAIISLKGLQEIILMLNADEAGEAAAVKHVGTLKSLLPHATISKVVLPAGEDVNSVLCTHDDAKVLSDLIDQRTGFFVSIETKNQPAAEIIHLPASGQSKLNTQNPELLIYDNCELHIEVLGGIKITGLDRMKVTLKVLHKDKATLPVWHNLDLYNHGQREQLVNHIAEVFELGAQSTASTLAQLTSALEDYRVQKIEALQPKQEPQPEKYASRHTSSHMVLGC